MLKITDGTGRCFLLCVSQYSQKVLNRQSSSYPWLPWQIYGSPYNNLNVLCPQLKLKKNSNSAPRWCLASWAATISLVCGQSPRKRDRYVILSHSVHLRTDAMVFRVQAKFGQYSPCVSSNKPIFQMYQQWRRVRTPGPSQDEIHGQWQTILGNKTHVRGRWSKNNRRRQTVDTSLQ